LVALNPNYPDVCSWNVVTLLGPEGEENGTWARWPLATTAAVSRNFDKRTQCLHPRQPYHCSQYICYIHNVNRSVYYTSKHTDKGLLSI